MNHRALRAVMKGGMGSRWVRPATMLLSAVFCNVAYRSYGNAGIKVKTNLVVEHSRIETGIYKCCFVWTGTISMNGDWVVILAGN